jgi:hypothetical protein
MNPSPKHGRYKLSSHGIVSRPGQDFSADFDRKVIEKKHNALLIKFDSAVNMIKVTKSQHA